MDEETLTVWLDTALLMLGGFVLMTVLMMSVMNPPATGKVKEDNPLPPWLAHYRSPLAGRNRR